MSTFCMDKLYTTHLKRFMFFKGVYKDDWMGPGVAVRKVFLALLFPNLIVSLVTAVNKIINQQHAATNFVCQSTTSMFLSFKIYNKHSSSV